MVPLSTKIYAETPGVANPLCSKHFKNTKEILKNTKEKLNCRNFEFLKGKSFIYDIVRP